MNTNIEKQWDCFLSHTWGINQQTHKQVIEIARIMRENRINVWIDEDNMIDSVGDDMREGIDYSHCFIAFITRNYLDKSNDKNKLNFFKVFIFITS